VRNEGLAVRRGVLLGGLALVLILAFVGWSFFGAPPIPQPQPPTQTKADEELKPGDESRNLQKPKTDVIVESILLPRGVRRDQNFEFTVGIFNSGANTASITNVEIRARLQGTDVPIGSAQFRQLSPRQSQSKAVRGRALHTIGLWKLRAIIVPFDYIDDMNNEQNASLVVN
jgi:hypothetical protein